MLWECEKRDPEFWSGATLLPSVCELLNQMIQCLENKRCQNYFIPKNNMMDHLSNTDIIADVRSLRHISKQEYKISKVLNRSEYFEMCHRKAGYQVEFQSWFYRGALMFAYALNTALQLDVSLLSRLQRALEEELYDVCRGLCHQRATAVCISKTENKKYLLKAKLHLETATRL